MPDSDLGKLASCAAEPAIVLNCFARGLNNTGFLICGRLVAAAAMMTGFVSNCASFLILTWGLTTLAGWFS